VNRISGLVGFRDSGCIPSARRLTVTEGGHRAVLFAPVEDGAGATLVLLPAPMTAAILSDVRSATPRSGSYRRDRGCPLLTRRSRRNCVEVHEPRTGSPVRQAGLLSRAYILSVAELLEIGPERSAETLAPPNAASGLPCGCRRSR